MAAMREPIQYYVIMKAETTGRQWEDFEKTKIVELSFVAVNRTDLARGVQKRMPAAQKLNMIFCPGRNIQEAATNSHDVTVDYVQNAPSFQQSAGAIVAFLQQLTKPVCLVAYNGAAFDFKHLKAECIDAGISFPEDLLCVDAMWIFYHILKRDPALATNKAIGLPDLYKKLFNEQIDPTTAEEKVLQLLDCAMHKIEAFLELADQRYKLFSDVKPYEYVSRKELGGRAGVICKRELL